MSTGFRVDPDELDGHARRVAALAGRVRTAAGAGPPFEPRAYGLLGQVFAVAVAAASDTGAAAVARVGDRSDALAEQLRAAGTDYRRTERTVAAGWGGPR